jgi:hypothetical protein
MTKKYTTVRKDNPPAAKKNRRTRHRLMAAKPPASKKAKLGPKIIKRRQIACHHVTGQPPSPQSDDVKL